MKSALITLSAVGSFTFARVAMACPYCAGRSDGGIAKGVILAAFVFFPFLVVFAVVKVLRAQLAAEGTAPKTEQSPV